MSIELVILSNHLILCCLLLLPLIVPSIRVFSNESAVCIKWPKYWSFSFIVSTSVNIQGWFPLGLLVGTPCSPRDSQESSPAPRFKSVNSWVLSLPDGPALCNIHYYCRFFVLFASSVIRLCRQGPCLSFSMSSPRPAHRKYLTYILFIEEGTSKRKKVWVLREQNLNRFDWLLLNSQSQAFKYPPEENDTLKPWLGYSSIFTNLFWNGHEFPQFPALPSLSSFLDNLNSFSKRKNISSYLCMHISVLFVSLYEAVSCQD